MAGRPTHWYQYSKGWRVITPNASGILDPVDAPAPGTLVRVVCEVYAETAVHPPAATSAAPSTVLWALNGRNTNTDPWRRLHGEVLPMQWGNSIYVPAPNGPIQEQPLWYLIGTAGITADFSVRLGKPGSALWQLQVEVDAISSSDASHTANINIGFDMVYLVET